MRSRDDRFELSQASGARDACAIGEVNVRHFSGDYSRFSPVIAAHGSPVSAGSSVTESLNVLDRWIMSVLTVDFDVTSTPRSRSSTFLLLCGLLRRLAETPRELQEFRPQQQELQSPPTWDRNPTL